MFTLQAPYDQVVYELASVTSTGSSTQLSTYPFVLESGALRVSGSLLSPESFNDYTVSLNLHNISEKKMLIRYSSFSRGNLLRKLAVSYDLKENC